MRKRTIRTAIVDDHPVVRKGVVETFAEEVDFEIVGQGASAEDAVRIAREHKPDLMILDVTMPGGGVEAAGEIHRLLPTVRILMLSIREDLGVVRAALKAGALGYVSKGVDGADLVAAARRIMSGVRFISPDLAARLIAGDDQDGQPSHGHASAPLPPLTARETEILDLVGEGLSNQAIAQRTGLSENTVKHYMTPLLHKLGVRNRTEAALLVRNSRPGRAD